VCEQRALLHADPVLLWTGARVQVCPSLGANTELVLDIPTVLLYIWTLSGMGDGMQMVCRWYTDGMQMVCRWYAECRYVDHDACNISVFLQG
jgi:hypothetical protein